MKIADILKKWVVKVDSDLKNTKIDWETSGSTSCITCIKDDHIYFGNYLSLFISF